MHSCAVSSSAVRQRAQAGTQHEHSSGRPASQLPRASHLLPFSIVTNVQQSPSVKDSRLCSTFLSTGALHGCLQLAAGGQPPRLYDQLNPTWQQQVCQLVLSLIHVVSSFLSACFAPCYVMQASGLPTLSQVSHLNPASQAGNLPRRALAQQDYSQYLQYCSGCAEKCKDCAVCAGGMRVPHEQGGRGVPAGECAVAKHLEAEPLREHASCSVHLL